MRRLRWREIGLIVSTRQKLKALDRQDCRFAIHTQRLEGNASRSLFVLGTDGAAHHELTGVRLDQDMDHCRHGRRGVQLECRDRLAKPMRQRDGYGSTFQVRRFCEGRAS